MIYLYYKAKYQFWSRQPVFHYHNLWYWIFPPGIIQFKKPKFDKYYDGTILFKKLGEISEEKKALFVSFIKTHYLPKKEEKYDPTSGAIMDYLNHHNQETYISMNFNNKIKLISTMTTRALECMIDDKDFMLYYVDYLCVHSRHRKKGIAPKTIYSHYVNHRYKHDNVIFFFKREGETTMIVPLTIYKIYLFDIKYWDKTAEFGHPDYEILYLSQQNIHLFIEIYDRMKAKFECVISPNIQNILKLCNEKHLYIILVLHNKQPIGFYVFRNPYTSYNGEKSMELTNSYSETTDEIFALGFLKSVNELYKKENFRYLLMEDLSNNDKIKKILNRRYRPIQESISSYYFYNFAYIPKYSNQTFILN